MRKFITHLMFFMLPLLIALTVLMLVIPRNNGDNTNYLAAIIDKHKRLESTSVPRLIFAGGSNLAFGMDSKLIEEEMKTAVVNLGLDAGLGLEFMLGELESSIKAGDTVYLSLEYWLSIYGSIIHKDIAKRLFPESRNYCSKSIIHDLGVRINETRNSFLDLILKNSSSESTVDTAYTSIYSRKAFNQYGDVTVHFNKAPTFVSNPTELKYVSWNGIELINEFYNHAKSKNVTVYFLYPCFPESEFKLNKSALKQLVREIRNNLEVPILNDYNDFVYHDSLFFDNKYHLNKLGRELRTQKIISILKRKRKCTTRNRVKGKFKVR